MLTYADAWQAVQRALLMRGVQGARVRADGYAAQYGPRAYGCGAGKSASCMRI